MTIRICLALCLVAVALASPPARADIIWVGDTATDAACDVDSLGIAVLGAALNGTDYDIIRLSNEVAYSGTHLVLSNFNVDIEGGYANCSGAPGSYAVVDGAGGADGAVFEFGCSGTGCDSRGYHTLRKLLIKNGEASGIDVSGNVEILLDDVVVASNATDTDGGAMRVDGSQNARVTVQGNSSFRDSTASGNGGGIWCSGRPADGYAFQIWMDHGLVYLNHAADGGGIYVTNGCRVRYQGTGIGDGINANTATGDGGGVAVTGGAHFELIGSGDAPASIDNNNAANGAGALVAGEGSIFAGVDSRIDGNTATLDGGGLLVRDRGHAVLSRGAPAGGCHRPTCMSISNNSAQAGGAARVTGLGVLTIGSAEIRFNHARYGSAFSLYNNSFDIENGYGTLHVYSSLIANNDGALAVIDSSESAAEIDGVTFAENLGTDADGWWGTLTESNSSIDSFTGEGIHASRSIFADDGAWAFQGTTNGVLEADCVVVANPGTDVPVPLGSVIGDPLLRNTAYSDFMPGNRSPALDLCANRGYLFDVEDINRYPRGSDVLQLGNVDGPYDAGAIESDLIFFGDFDPD
ncbi:MAG TPA: hypothetical protein VFG73_09185 [Rhodanobacteraceae bacterium]|nr:hypothetical protein [Rhodanobacteraceae bacterium]